MRRGPGGFAPRCISRPSRYACMRCSGVSRRSSSCVVTWWGIAMRSADVTTLAGTAEVIGLDGGGAAVAAFQARAALAEVRMSASVEASLRSAAGTPVSADRRSLRFSASNCPMRRSFSAARSSSVMWTPLCAVLTLEPSQLAAVRLRGRGRRADQLRCRNIFRECVRQSVVVLEQDRMLPGLLRGGGGGIGQAGDPGHQGI